MDILIAAIITALIVLSSSALMIAGILFIDRREYMRKEGMDPLRVIVPAKATIRQPSGLDRADSGLDTSEWI